ncbi:MAG: hypothetical protein M1817_001779 [Caeruleum heppii]|nr:MAG: hypothetical protein M1817_001779 [Caeruleum heppii]
MASCTYDPQRPHTIENFDPAEADPRAGLTCLGPGPPFPLPWQYGDWDPNAVSLQQLCAKPQYGGSGPFRHIGGFCPVFAPVLPPPLGPGRAEDVLAFDNTPGAAPSNLLPNPRVQPIEVPRLYEDEFFAPARDSYEIRIDLYDDYLVNPMIHRGQGNNVRRVTPIWRMREITQRTDAGGFSFVSIAPDNEITCEGSIPDWPLPAPFVANDFATLQHLCAVQLSGGNAYVALSSDLMSGIGN